MTTSQSRAAIPEGTTRFIGLETVLGLTSFSRSTLYALISKGQFPAQYKIGPRRVAWRLADIERWISDRMEVTA